MRGTVVQISISRGGLPKRPVPEAVLTPLGVEGDSFAHSGIHGGPDRAVLVITAETVEELTARGYPLFFGAMGENLTTRGLDRHQMRPGQRYQVGGAVIELTRVRSSCFLLDVYGEQLKDEIYHKGIQPPDPAWGMSGFLARVVQPGPVGTDDVICLLDAAV